jgi:hypothetical protein
MKFNILCLAGLVLFLGAFLGCEEDDNNTTQTEDNNTTQTEDNNTTQSEDNNTTQSEDNNTTQSDGNALTQAQVPFSPVTLHFLPEVAKEFVIRSQTEWEAYMARSVQRIWEYPDTGASTAPPCDFETQMVVGRYLGEYRVTFSPENPMVTQVVETQEKIQVYYEHNVSDTVGFGFSWPYTAIRIPQSDLPVQWVHE